MMTSRLVSYKLPNGATSVNILQIWTKGLHLCRPGHAPAKTEDMEAPFMFHCGGDSMVKLVGLHDEILITEVHR